MLYGFCQTSYKEFNSTRPLSPIGYNSNKLVRMTCDRLHEVAAGEKLGCDRLVDVLVGMRSPVGGVGMRRASPLPLASLAESHE